MTQQPKGRNHGSPKLWLARARSNLERALQEKPSNVFWEDLCFDAQQAAEKALKAILLHKRTVFPFTHDLGVLFKSIEKTGVPLPNFAQDAAATLTGYAAATRYPGAFEPVSELEYKEAVRLAKIVVTWAETQLTL